ncbi:bifunctional UDP-N-acetylglucosamine diphosphorylase/glucosamine-1-phosphate N-acetyltransferase GlmU [Candidatus Dormiibacter inghamiae]
MSDLPLSAVILAAGRGIRMRSRTPKVLHEICGRSMIDWVLGACREVGIESDRLFVVHRPGEPGVVDHLAGKARLVAQPEPLGTGHALAQVPAEWLGQGDVLVLNGDGPLLRPETIRRFLAAHRAAGLPASLASVDDASRSDGRVLRNRDGGLAAIIEYRDLTEQSRNVSEINVGLYCFAAPQLSAALAQLRPDNQAGELYLVDVFQHLSGTQVVKLPDPEETIGINDRVQLARAETAMRRRLLESLMLDGVTVRDPTSTYVAAGVSIGQDTVLEPYTMVTGTTRIGKDCRIGPFAQISDCQISDGVRIDSSWLSGATLGSGSDCGPFSKLRAGTELKESVHVGSFAELVRSEIGSRSAVPHVSYLGDATVGEGVNIGAGSITANYDGRQKKATVIEDDCFIGVDTMLVAPRRLGRGARTGAGAVVTKDVPAGVTVVGVPARAIPHKERA